MTNIYTELDSRISSFLNERNSLSDYFKSIVRDRSLPLAERVAVWEDSASILLEQGDWLSSCPEVLRPFLTEYTHRGEVVYFSDLVSSLILVDDWSDLYQISDEEIWSRLEHLENSNIKERFEQVLSLDVYAFKVDW